MTDIFVRDLNRADILELNPEAVSERAVVEHSAASRVDLRRRDDSGSAVCLPD